MDGCGTDEKGNVTWKALAISLAVAVVLSVAAGLLLGGGGILPRTTDSAARCGAGSDCCRTGGSR